MERRMNVQKNRRKILAAYNCNYGRRPCILPAETRFQGDEDIVYLHCDPALPSMTCDGLVCITEPDWFNVLNPSTGQLRRFPPGPDPVKGAHANWLLGFGRDKVTGSSPNWLLGFGILRGHGRKLGGSRRCRFLRKGILSSMIITRGCSDIIPVQMRFVASLLTYVLYLLTLKNWSHSRLNQAIHILILRIHIPSSGHPNAGQVSFEKEC